MEVCVSTQNDGNQDAVTKPPFVLVAPSCFFLVFVPSSSVVFVLFRLLFLDLFTVSFPFGPLLGTIKQTPFRALSTKELLASILFAHREFFYIVAIVLPPVCLSFCLGVDMILMHTHANGHTVSSTTTTRSITRTTS